MTTTQQATDDTPPTVPRYDVNRVRGYALDCANGAVRRMRGLLSMLPGGGEMADLLRGDAAEEALAGEIATALMAKLGHAENVDDVRSPLRRAARGKAR